MIDSIVFTPPTALGATPALSAAAGGAVTLHSNSSTCKISKADGLIGTPAPRDVVYSLPGRDGTTSDTRDITERLITLEGELWGTSARDVLDQWGTINSALHTSLLSPGQLTITLPAGSGSSTQRWAMVELAGSPQTSLEGAKGYLSFQVVMRAMDPLWYGITKNTSALSIASVSNISSSSATVTNAGTAPVSPMFTWTPVSAGLYFEKATVTVPTAFSTVSPQGSTIVLNNAGGASGLMSNNDYIDCARRYTNTVYLLSATTEWPVLYPGASSWNWTQQYAGSSSASTCTLSWYDGWW